MLNVNLKNYTNDLLSIRSEPMNLKIASKVFDNGKEPLDWQKDNMPSKDLVYVSGQKSQLSAIQALGELSLTSPKIVGSHMSKSVILPVTCFKFSPYNQVQAYVFVRDNFYNIKISVISEVPIDIPFGIIHIEKSNFWVKEQKEKCANYSKKSINDLMFDTDDWYSNWSSGSAIIRQDDRVYVADSVLSVYCEGISRLGFSDNVFTHYKQNSKEFSASMGSYGQIAFILDIIAQSIERGRYKKLRQADKETNDLLTE